MPSITAQLDQLNHLLPTLPHQYHRLILVVGQHGAGKTRLLKELSRRANGAIPYLNLNLAMTEGSMPCTVQDMQARFARLVEGLTQGKDPNKVRIVIEWRDPVPSYEFCVMS